MESELCPKHGKECYAVALNAAGDGKTVFRVTEFCDVCGSHLAASGICLNACHLSKSSRERFANLLKACSRE